MAATQLTLFSPEELLGEPLSADYQPGAYGGLYHILMSRFRIPFALSYVDEIGTDPRIKLGLKMIKGPIITNARFQVETEASKANKAAMQKAQMDAQNALQQQQEGQPPAQVEVQTEDDNLGQFVLETFEQFWRNAAMGCLRSLEWGFSVSEVMYDQTEEGMFTYDHMLTNIRSLDVLRGGGVLTINGRYAGALIKGVGQDNLIYLGGPKGFHHVNDRDKNRWYGVSELFGCFIPWNEKWSEGGYRDIRRVWFHKNSFEGGIMYHPPGNAKLPSGQQVTNKDLAREMIEKKRTGATMTLPSIRDQSQQRTWEYDPPQPNAVPAGLLEYGANLDMEELEGLCVPPEIISPDSQGAEIPKVAFYSMLQEKLNYLAQDFDEQVVRVLVKINTERGFFKSDKYKVIPQRLLGNPYEVEEQMEINGEDNPQAPAYVNQGKAKKAGKTDSRKPTNSNK